MNERINELRLEAGISRLHEVPYMVAVNKEGEIIEALEGLERFAELIIRECIDVVVDVLPDIVPESKDGIHPAWHLKEHFGVEE